MGEVFLAEQLGPVGFKRQAVVKRLITGSSTSDDDFVGFTDEARLAAQLQHPNIVRTHEFFTDGENKVLAMEFIPGCDGRTVLECAKKRGEVLLELMALTITRDICLGLEHAHAMKRSEQFLT